MTYEKFCLRVIAMYVDDENTKMDRKRIAKVARGLMIELGMLAITLGYLINSVASRLGTLAGGLIFAILVFVVFDYVSETKEVFQRSVKWSKLWFFSVILMIIAVILMKINWR